MPAKQRACLSNSMCWVRLRGVFAEVLSRVDRGNRPREARIKRTNQCRRHQAEPKFGSMASKGAKGASVPPNLGSGRPIRAKLWTTPLGTSSPFVRHRLSPQSNRPHRRTLSSGWLSSPLPPTLALPPETRQAQHQDPPTAAMLVSRFDTPLAAEQSDMYAETKLATHPIH